MKRLTQIIEQTVKDVLNENGNYSKESAASLWVRYIQYFESMTAYLKKRYRESLVNQTQITDEMFDQMNDKVHHDLDTLASY